MHLLRAQILDKLVRNMNYTIIKLNEPGVKERYKINDLDQLKFDARLIVSKVVQLYLNLRGAREFL